MESAIVLALQAEEAGIVSAVATSAWSTASDDSLRSVR
jgi:hypothetical protein